MYKCTFKHNIFALIIELPMKFLKTRNVLDIIAGILTFFSFVFALLSSISPFIHPANFKIGLFASILLPFTLLFSILMLVYWLIRKEWLFLLPLISIVINSGFLISTFQFRSEPKFSIYEENETLKIISYNVHEFMHINSQLSIGRVREFVSNENADIICFQEFDASNQLHINELKNYFDDYPYYAISESNNENIGMAIFSRYQIINWRKINFENTGNGYLWADIKIAKRLSVRVINVHLQTTSLGQQNLAEISRLKKFISNSSIRALQSESVSNLIDTTSHSIIVCGDFNDSPSSYTYEKIKGKSLIDGFREAGYGFGGTFNGFKGIGKLYRIDYIFHSRDFLSIKYTTPYINISDHFPVISELVYQN